MEQQFDGVRFQNESLPELIQIGKTKINLLV